jgi:hypothetical protein
MTTRVSPWNLTATTATLQCGPLSGQIDLANLGGLDETCWLGKPLHVRSLSLRLPLDRYQQPSTLTDCYSRGNDLVATFERVAPGSVSPQVYWRARHHEDHGAVGIEVIISMHTDLLDSQPRSAVWTSVKDSRALRTAHLDPSGFRETSAGSYKRMAFTTSNINLMVCRREWFPKVSYAEMVHPDDFCELDPGGSHNAAKLEWMLFPERLEKGVIRRARISGWFMPAENDLATAVELAKRFVAEPPPLTT